MGRKKADACDGVVPEAMVTITNTDTALTRSGTTAGDGSYRFSCAACRQLPSGRQSADSGFGVVWVLPLTTAFWEPSSRFSKDHRR